MFYGWYIVAVILAAGTFAGPTSQSFIAILVPHITEDTGWSRTSLAGAVTFAGIMAGITAPFVGHLADRYNPRILMSIGVVVLGGSYLLMANVAAIWQFYLGYFVVRGLGQNLVSGVVPRTVVVNWFRRMRGRTIGMVHTAHPVGTFLMAPAALLVINAGWGWRSVWLVMGVAVLVLLLIPVWFVVRGTPEEMGLRPDGDAAPIPGSAEAARVARPEYSWSLGAASRTSSFWLLMIAILLGNIGGGGLPFLMPSYYNEAGFATGVGVAAVSGFAIAGAAATTLWGFLAERFSERLLAAFTMILGGSASLAFLIVRDPVTAVLVGVVLGIAARGEGSILMILIAQYFGRRSYGAISGVATQSIMIGLGLGPLSLSLLRDALGSYTGVFWLAAIPFGISAVLLVLARKPVPPVSAGVAVE